MWSGINKLGVSTYLRRRRRRLDGGRAQRFEEKRRTEEGMRHMKGQLEWGEGLPLASMMTTATKEEEMQRTSKPRIEAGRRRTKTIGSGLESRAGAGCWKAGLVEAMNLRTRATANDAGILAIVTTVEEDRELEVKLLIILDSQVVIERLQKRAEGRPTPEGARGACRYARNSGAWQ
ncbi:hypothetical protein BDZ91DRAFT_800366 [Kalaharituber pfeilii]|nr:hypothetical protein BDZ91DRAFT_800366 [Kalaharituber pfeilii]